MMKLAKVAVVLALVVFGGSVVQADPVPATATETPAGKADPCAPITDVRLGELLDGLGLAPRKGTYNSGALYYDVTVTSKDYDFNIRVGLSPNKRSVWLMSYLSDIPANAPAERFRGLLEAVNSKTGKMQFRLVGSQLKADQPMDNVAVTSVRLRKELNDMAESLQDTHALWDVSKWTDKAVKTDKPEQK